MTLLAEEFNAHIDSITRNTLTNSASKNNVVAFSLPTHVIENAANETLPNDAMSAFETSKKDLMSSSEEQKTEATKTVDTFQSNKDQSAFDKAINEQRDKNIAAFSAQQDSLAKKLKAAGAQYPAAQNVILKAYSVVSNFFSVIGQKISEFFGDLVAKIVQWVKTAINKIGEFFSNVGSSIESAFSFL